MLSTTRGKTDKRLLVGLLLALAIVVAVVFVMNKRQQDQISNQIHDYNARLMHCLVAGKSMKFCNSVVGKAP